MHENLYLKVAALYQTTKHPENVGVTASFGCKSAESSALIAAPKGCWGQRSRSLCASTEHNLPMCNQQRFVLMLVVKV